MAKIPDRTPDAPQRVGQIVRVNFTSRTVTAVEPPRPRVSTPRPRDLWPLS